MRSLIVILAMAVGSGELSGSRAEKPQTADDWATRAEAQLAEGEQKPALKSAGRALDIDPRHARALLVAGTVELMRGNFELAIERLERAAVQDAELPWLHYRLGSARLRHGARLSDSARRESLRAAVVAFDAELARTPDHTASLARKVQALTWLGESRAASDTFDLLLSLEAESLPVSLSDLGEQLSKLLRDEELPADACSVDLSVLERASAGAIDAAAYPPDAEAIDRYAAHGPRLAELQLVGRVATCRAWLHHAGVADVDALENARIRLPKTLHRETPEYPAGARVARRSGIVYAMSRLDREGRLRDVVVLRHPRTELGYGFPQATVEALGRWRYEPGRVDGQAVDVPILIWTTFELQ